MFYSQFILAKKGPLGTIWIAAHLERKLRKNQVADTDIGVSVDSIICPEVPIALRLSSHLMLGVVRIYSRKVNYLFDDCSDALLKIKQAFRSVAVDLPPEESTAPYHSITLPETFDLDDFELPDAVFDGNYVDHHVSTREQITLQDTMNGAVFSTTQFGLDERFGDGDASQIGLDLDEELFLEKSRTIQNSSIAPEKNNADIEPDTPLAVMDVDDGQNSFVHHDHNIPETTKDLPNAYGYNIRTPDLNLMVSSAEGTGDIPLPPNTIDPSFLDSNSTMGNHFDHAQAPQTPGLLEEAVPVHAQEMPDMCQLDKPFASDDVEEVARGELEWQHKQTPKNDALPLLPECSVGIMGGTAESVRVDNDEKLGTSQNEVLSSENVGIKHDCTVIIPQEALMDATPSGTEETLTLKTSVGEIIGNRDSSILTDNKPVHVGLSNMGNTVLSHNDKPEMHNHSFQEPAVHANSSVTDSYTPISNFLLRPSFTANPTHSSSLENCSLSYNNPPSRGEMVSEVNTPDVTGLLMKEQGFHSVNLLDTETNMHRNLQSGSLNSALNKEYDLPATSACIPIENPNCSASSKYPDPERALQAGINEHGFQRGMEHLRVEKMVPASLGSSPLNKEFVLPATAASVQSQNLNYSASSRYPDPQSVLRASVNEHGFQRGTEQLRVEKPVPVSLDISPVNKDYVLPATSASIQIENLNYSASSKYPTPERVPQTGFNEHGLQRGMEHFRVEKTVPASFNSSPLNKEYVLPATSASIQIENLNYSASSVYPEPQRMLRANSSEHAMQHGMEQSRVVAPVSLGNSPLHKEYLLPSSSGFVPMENRNYSAGSGYLQPEGMLPATANQHGLGRDLEQARAMATASLENSPFHRGYVLPATSVGIQTENLNCSASSEYPEPERMLRATFSEHHLQWNMGQSTVEKVVTESIGSVDRLNTLSGKKRRLMDSSPTLLNESSMTMPMAPSSNKNISGIANDEDLLASILVGRTTPPLNVKSTPTLPVIPSSKRARQNTKMGAPKRKVLLDDTMVLHADTIRQQLTSTEDIRRVRKKAPCSRSDIWRIQKCLLEEELFGESTLTGISDKLTLLHYRVYNMNDTFRPRVESNPSPAHISKEQTQRHVSEEQTRRHVSEEQTRRHVSEEQTQRHVSEEQTQRQVTEELTQTKTPSADANLEVTDASVMNDIIDNSVNLKYPDAHNFVHEKNSDFFEKPFANELRQNGDENVEIASHQSNGLGSIASEPHDSERHNMSLNNGVISGSDQHNESGSLLTDKNNTKEPSVATIDDLSLPPEQNSSMLSDLTANKVVDFCSADNSNNTENIVTATKSRNDQYNEIRSSLTEKNNVTEPSVAIVDGPSLSPEPHSSMPPGFTAEQPDKFRTAGNLNISESIASVPESIDDSVIVPSHTLDADINTSVKMDSLDNHDVLPCQLPPESATNYEAMEVELGARRNDQFESSCPTEDNQHVTSCQLESETVLENAVLMVEEACSDKEVDVGVPALAESHDGEDTGDSWDGGDPVDDEDDSGYLNVDDEVDFDDESNYDVPNPEEAQSQENSGWSARTRGVARYLKLLFDEDTGRTRHVVALDRLLAGKTRKEASRMFFETLVLKTKDYIHVEQEQSFANIDIKPKPKLLKLEF